MIYETIIILNIWLGQLISNDALTFFIAISTTLWIKVSHTENQKKHNLPHFIQDFISGFRYTFKNKGILYLISIMSLITFFIGLLQALLGPMILSFANAKTLGISQTISTIGMLIGSCFLGIMAKSSNQLDARWKVGIKPWSDSWDWTG